MMDTNEQGFLSHKFDDFGSEPIPNGWSEIDKQIAKDRRRKVPFWWFTSGVLLLLLSGMGVWLWNQSSKFSPVVPTDQHTASTQKPGSTLSEDKPAIPRQSGTTTPSHPETIASQKVNTSAEPPKADIPSTSHQTLKKLPYLKEDKKSESQVLVIVTDDEYSPKNELATEEKKPKRRTSKRPVLVLAQAEKMDQTKSDQFLTDERRIQAAEKLAVRKPLEDKDGVPQPVQDAAAEDKAIHSNEKQSFITDRINIAYPELKSPLLMISEESAPKVLTPIPIENTVHYFPSDSSLKKVPGTRMLSLYAGASAGFAQKTIAVDQVETADRIDLKNSFNGEASWVAQVNGKVLYQVPKLSWLQTMAAISLGVYEQNIRLQNVVKQPTGYTMQIQDSLNYSVTPTWQKMNENRTQKMVFANFELGIKPLISKRMQSGPFASVLVWTRLSESHSTSLGQGAGFIQPKHSIFVGYKMGYQHLISNKWQVEVFTTALPQQLMSTTDGISIRPQVFGIGLNRKLW